MSEYNGAKNTLDFVKLAIDEIRENRQEINKIKEKLSNGVGKIATNKEAIITIKADMKMLKYKAMSYGGITGVIFSILTTIVTHLL